MNKTGNNYTPEVRERVAGMGKEGRKRCASATLTA